MKQWSPVSLWTTNGPSSQCLSLCCEESEEGTETLTCNKVKSTPSITYASKLQISDEATSSLVPCSHFAGSVSPSSDLQAAEPTSLPLSVSLHFSECSSQMISRTSQGTKPLFFPLATLMKPLRSPSLLTQIWGEKWNLTLMWKTIKNIKYRWLVQSHKHITYFWLYTFRAFTQQKCFFPRN